MRHFNALLAIVLILSIAPFPVMAETVFTFQGRLGIAGAPADGEHDFIFRLFDAQSGGTQIGGDLPIDTVDVTDGVFTVQLDFGEAPFGSGPRWLEIDVRESGSGAYSTLAPRNRIGASPFAVETMSVASGAVGTAALQDAAVTSAKIADGNVNSVDLANYAVSNLKLGNDAVTSVKIADGTITPADVDGGLYARKTQVVWVTQSQSIGIGTERITVSCPGASDLPVVHACNLPSALSYLTVLGEHLSGFDSETQAATLTCVGANRAPESPEELTATLGCIPVSP